MHDRFARFGGVHGARIQIGEQAVAEADHVAEDAQGGLAVVPREAGAHAVQAREGGQQAELGPANVQVRRRLAVEAADVVTPEGVAAGAQTQASAQGRGQVLVRGVRIARPLRGVTLAARVRGSAPDHARASCFLSSSTGQRLRVSCFLSRTTGQQRRLTCFLGCNTGHQVVVDQRIDGAERLRNAATEFRSVCESGSTSASVKAEPARFG